MVIQANCKINLGLDVVRKREDGYHELETVMLPLIAATLFGDKDFVKILGVLVSANSAGYALSAPLCNLVFDITGSYHFCFYIMGALIIFVTVLFQLGLRAAKRRQSMAAEANT